ncbi:replication initiation protein [Sulfurirhabdus autotrophica]|nr:replication initiation protein [Sulfurirhabdus autotrophica]
MTQELNIPTLAEDIVSKSKQLDNLVSKSNSLVRASYKLTLQEQRLVLLAISKLDSRKIGSHPNPKHDQMKVRISAIDFAEVWGISPKKAYEELREASNELFERKITEIDGKKVSKMRWVSKSEYHDGEGWVSLTFSLDVLPFITLLRDKFTSYKLSMVSGLRSVYSIRLFELFAQFQDTGILRIHLEDLTNMLEAPYTRYTDMARRVIRPAVEELRLKSNLEIEWRAITEGRSVKTLEFKFKEAAQGKLDL